MNRFLLLCLLLAASVAIAMETNAFESSNVITINSTSASPLVSDIIIAGGRTMMYQSYECITSVATAAAGIYVVDKTDVNVSDGFGPFCSDTAQCPLGARIAGDSALVFFLAASGTPNLTCRMGHR